MISRVFWGGLEHLLVLCYDCFTLLFFILCLLCLFDLLLLTHFAFKIFCPKFLWMNACATTYTSAPYANFIWRRKWIHNNRVMLRIRKEIPQRQQSPVADRPATPRSIDHLSAFVEKSQLLPSVFSHISSSIIYDSTSARPPASPPAFLPARSFRCVCGWGC